MKQFFLVGLITILSPLLAQDAPAAATAEVAIGGTYKVEGKNPDGGAYEGTVVISGDTTNGYKFKWTIAADSYDGTGTLEGDVLTVDWGAPEPVIYKVKENGARLKGKWGPKGKGKEKLTRMESEAPATTP